MNMEKAKDYKIIAQYGDYTLIDKGSEYVVAYGFDTEKTIWAHGVYFTPYYNGKLERLRMLSKAMEFFRTKVDEEYISRSRLEEIATDSLHGLLEDDEETAMDFFDNELELSDFERNYFGISKRGVEQ